MAQIIRMTETDLTNMIEETVLRILTEGAAWDAFSKSANLGQLKNYAIDRIWKGSSYHNLGDDSEEEKRKKQYNQDREDLQKYGDCEYDEMQRRKSANKNNSQS